MGDQTMKGRAIVTLLGIAALLGAFVLGRVTAPGGGSSEVFAACRAEGRTRVNTPEQFAGAEQVGYFSQCDYDAAQPARLGEAAGRISIYAAMTGEKVLAWWYLGCGLPEGVVAVGAGRPSSCATTGTTASG